MRLLFLLGALGLMVGCSRPPATSESPAPSASPTPLGTPALSDWISEDAGSRLHFMDNLQWYTPKSWKGDEPWLTPRGILVKQWLISRGERELDSGEVARLFEATSEMSHLKITGAPEPVAQDDFHLWMLRGRGQKQNARHRVEPVVWAACLVEPQPEHRQRHGRKGALLPAPMPGRTARRPATAPRNWWWPTPSCLCRT